ncbi:PREDICTED: LEAF RUST 10 DISEASE-RESISTANCE LOCUS RECEPTOR-LIKE PROTEIN KINASE-like 1.1 isoform X1 [Lupinus angustifolius]|nr:PREDICTED: LEAF RUST 10 DISEASE-RESISTANCE LOCUS RECEPTOR-LIKE PROTEIN KINASE-like 1.1 isoform X1 [Lupinus angustifolius]
MFEGFSSLCTAFNYNVSDIIVPHDSPMMSLQILNTFKFIRCNRNRYDANENIPVYHRCSDYDIYHGHEFYYFYEHEHLDGCSAIQLPVALPPIFVDPLQITLSSELVVEVTLSEPCFDCYHVRRGQCRADKGNISCVNTNDVRQQQQPNFATGISIGLAIMIIIALFVILFMHKRRYNKSSCNQNQPRNINSAPSSNIITETGTVIYFGIPVFSYEELQEATNNFDQARELGEGGFGTVYHGKLRDRREVAVKRLYEHNYRPVESFINEIQILTRLHHTNLVSLYGCTSRHSHELLLVYEYVPNGTLDSHLHGDKAKPGLMPWHVRMKIAIETASALCYLHASDIIHRDVKTSNILLENNFCVKVADFGLSRLFPIDVTHVSTAPRGTPGYVDPDYHICYQLTSKSDVYSFGVVLVELISSLPAVDMNREREEVKLANLAVKKFRRKAFSELVDPSLGFHSDENLERMITSVAELAFQCLQRDKDLRPSMGEVLEVLQRIESSNDVPGNLEGIDVHCAETSCSYALPNTLMKPQRLHQTL